MSATEETIDATLEANGQLRLSHQPRLPPGPVRVTIRAAAALGPRPGLADVIREIAAEQRARGFPGRSAADLRAEDDARLDEDAERDRELEAAQQCSTRRRNSMLTILREFLARSDDGQQQMMLCECLVESDTTTQHNVNTRTLHRERYFRQRHGGMRAMRAEEIEPGVFRLTNGLVVHEVR